MTASTATPPALLSFDRVAIHLGGREILSPTSFEVARGVAAGAVIECRKAAMRPSSSSHLAMSCANLRSVLSISCSFISVTQ